MNRFIVLALCAFFVSPFVAHAATLNIGGAENVGVGDTISVPLQLTTAAGESANAVSASIVYPSALLELVSISKASSVISLWAEEPSYSQSAGTARLEGVILNPGYSGTNGTVVVLVFQVKAAGAASIVFSDASVLANDGKGTNILTSAPARTISIADGVPSKPAPAVAAKGLVITSSTHPNQKKWYKAKTVELAWKNPPGTTALKLGYDKNSQGEPGVLYNQPLEQKTLALNDGVWYFHLQAKDANGWRPVVHFKIQIDITPPAPMRLRFPHGATTTDPRPIALFNTIDSLSGISHYDLKIKGKGLFNISQSDAESNPYTLPEQEPGMGELVVIAYDQAGNTTEAQATFEVIGIDAPILDPVGDIEVGDIFQVSGLSVPYSRIDLFLTDEAGVITTQWARVGAQGAFRVIWQDKLSSGSYQLSAQATDERGAKSIKIPPVRFTVQEPPLFQVGSLSITRTISTIFLVVILVGLVGLLWYVWTRYILTHHVHHKKGRSAGVAHSVLHKQFKELKDAIEEEVHGLEKVRSRRELTVEEERFINRFKKMLDRAEGVIEKELEDK